MRSTNWCICTRNFEFLGLRKIISYNKNKTKRIKAPMASSHLRSFIVKRLRKFKVFKEEGIIVLNI